MLESSEHYFKIVIGLKLMGGNVGVCVRPPGAGIDSVMGWAEKQLAARRDIVSVMSSRIAALLLIPVAWLTRTDQELPARVGPPLRSLGGNGFQIPDIGRHRRGNSELHTCYQIGC